MSPVANGDARRCLVRWLGWLVVATKVTKPSKDIAKIQKKQEKLSFWTTKRLTIIKNDDCGGRIMKAGTHLLVVCPCLWLSSKKEEGYQFFGVQVQSVTLLSAFRLMSFVWSLSCCFLRGASFPNSSTSLLTNRRTGK